jgi:hypothetical protein
MQAFVYLFIPSSIMQVAILSLQRPKGLEKCLLGHLHRDRE